MISYSSLSTQLRKTISGAGIARFFVFIVYCIIPFLGGNHLPLFYMTIDKFWIENIFLLCLIIPLIFLFLSKKNVVTFAWKRFFLFFAPFMAINIFSLFFTWNTLNTLREINTLFWVAGAVFLMSSFPDKDMILKALVIGAFLSSLCAIIQFTILYPGLMNVFRHTRYAALLESNAIPFSSYEYHNILGGYLASIVPISLYFALFEKKIFYMVTTVVILAGLTLTTSRTGIGLATLTVMVSLALLVKEHDIKGGLRLLGLICAGLLIAVLLMSTHNKNTPDSVQMEIKYKISNITTQIKTLNTRTEIWKAGLRAFYDKPVLGYGAGTFGYAYEKYFDGGFATKYAHSTFIKIIVELGIIGILCWFFYIAGCFMWMQNVLWSKKNVYVLCAACSYFIFGLVDFSFNAKSHVITFFLLTSFLIQGNAEIKSTCKENKETILISQVMTILLVILCLFSFYFITRDNLANKAIENGSGLEQYGLPLIEAYHAYEDAIEKMPLNHGGLVKGLTAPILRYNTEDDPVKKEEAKLILSNYLRKMEKIKDRSSGLYYAIGMGYATLGNNEKADYYLNKALFYYPSSSYYVLKLAEYNFNHGDNDKAIKTIRSFDPYMSNYEIARNPDGFNVYKMRDLEVEIMLRGGNIRNALSLAHENLQDAERERFVITSVRARELVKNETVLDHLQKRVDSIKLLIEKK